MPEKLKILVVAPEASSISEEAIMADHFLSGAYTEIELHHVVADFSPRADGRSPGILQQLGKVLAFIKAFGRVRKQVRPDALLFVARPHGTLAESAALLAARRQVPRTILFLNASGLAEQSARLSGWAKKLFPKAFGQPDLTIVTSHSSLPDAEFLHSKSSAVIPYGVPEAWEDGPRRERNHVPFLLYMGPISEENGLGVLIEACRNLRSRNVDFRCRIVGKASSPDQLAAFQKQAADLADVVTFSEPVQGDAKWDLFAESDIFCNPSFHPSEPLSIPTIEAMMSGLPVMATNWKALPEIVADGKSGFVAAPRDAKAFGDRLVKLIRDSLLCQIMGNSGRNRYLSLYGVEVFQREMERILFESLAQQRSPGG